VTRDFDFTRVIAKADITIQGEQVFATITEGKLLALNGLYPALGGRIITCRTQLDNCKVIEAFDVLTVSLCAQPNADPTIPPL
jgi:hypothetical protein